MYVVTALLRRVARRCQTHDRAWYSKTRALEESLGMQPSKPPDSFTDEHADPALIDCGNRWCQYGR